ncbi:hypothetical protein F2Q69_00017399 [Brassica cretica]|uniref:Uncharacterized protein n=1 Tax=Brassica cretica TaxID=69181 RepID=A0A8S9R627_BRACR|nr:hypothetical protein F2Q69_00017399 [Brassica cretica]
MVRQSKFDRVLLLLAPSFTLSKTLIKQSPSIFFVSLYALTHLRLLKLAEDPATRPVFEVRCVSVIG